MFTWGYWGWGSSTKKLKQAVDLVERSRGYEPPYFVDVRMKRSGRASGFQGATFERLLGKNRYRWMPALGNKRIKTRKGPKLQINEPEAAEELLGLALTLRKKHQRMIFFCQCGLPLDPDRNPPQCHRVEVASLLLKVARQRNVNLSIAEWPGGDPKRVTYEITDQQAEEILHGHRSPSLGRRLPTVDLLALPWSSLVRFHSPHQSFFALADAARFEGGQWKLPLLYEASQTDKPETLKRKAERDRCTFGLNTRQIGR
jgi:hypothetical protein